MLRYIDFVPKMIRAPGVFHPGEHEDFAACVTAANQWLAAQPGFKLVQLETVVLPNIWCRYEEGSGDAALIASVSHPNSWHQFLRCWYEDPS